MKLKGTLIALCLFALIVTSQAMAQEPGELIAVRNAFAKAIDDHDIDAILSLFADDFVADGTVFAAPMSNPEEIRAMWENLFDESPDWGSTEEERVFAVGNIVVVEHASIGSNTRDAGGAPWTWAHVDVYEFEGLKIKRHMSYGDYSSILVQVGWAPAPELPELVPSFPLPDVEPTGLTPLEAAEETIARWNSKDLAHWAKMFDPNVDFYLAPMGVPMDKNAEIAVDELYLQAFSDRQAEIVRTLDLGYGWVLNEVVFSGTHTGPYFGIPATGYPFRIRGAILNRFTTDGLLTYHHAYFDNLTLTTQITTAPFPLDGIWITTYPTGSGNIISTTVYAAQDAAKTRYSGTLEFLNSFGVSPLYPGSDPSLTISAGGEAVMVGPNQYKATYLFYERKFDVSTGIVEIVGMSTAEAHFELLGPNLLQGHGTRSFYMAAQDADQDGFPDEGETPVVCFPMEWTGKRLTAIPGCTE
jgi:hypothetical protein